jgi:hypothetical protein
MPSIAPARRVAWWSVIVAVLLTVVGVTAANLGGAAGAATVAQGLDCGVGGAQTMNVTGTAPATVVPGGTFTVDLAVGQGTASGAEIKDLAWSFEAPAGTSIVSGSAALIGSGSGTLGTVSTSVSGNVVQLKATGPVANGGKFTPPTLRFGLTASAAAGTALSVRVRQSPAYNLKAAGFGVTCSTTGTRGALTTTTVQAAATSSSSTASTASTAPSGTVPTTTTTTVPGPTTVSWSPSGPCGTVGTTTVPAGATTAALTAVGGSGGKGGQVAGATGASGQAGGQVTAVMSVTPGQTISGVVGCNGSNGGSSSGPGGAGYGTGGSGGQGHGVVTSDHYGGGGGGASAICVGASCLAGQGGVSPRLVAGGGGGGGSLNCAGTSVGAGGRGGNGSVTSAGGGSGASGLSGGNGLHSSGGAGGVNSSGSGAGGGNGGNGSQGSGTNSGGGGAGGGYRGGTGGTGTSGGAALCAGGGGGGGGSSWAADGLTGASFTQPSGAAAVSVVFTVAATPTPDIVPFETTSDLVGQQYQDLAGRQPTSEELDAAVDGIDGLEIEAEDVILELLTDDQRALDAQVIRLYLAYFGRPPETAGLEYWVDAMEAGKSVHTASNQFASMQEFRTLYGSLTNRQFVELVYQNVLGRPGEADGVDYWTAELDSGRRKRGTVMTQFSETPENRTAKTVHVGVVRIYLAMLESTPKKTYLNAAVAPFLADDATVAETLDWVADDIRHSTAYATRVG